jgi:Leucine Rich repeat
MAQPLSSSSPLKENDPMKSRFSIRSMLIVISIVGVVLAVIVVVAVKTRQERRQALQMKYHREGADIRLADWSDEIIELTTWNPRKFGIDRIIKDAPTLRVLRIQRNCDDAILEKIARLRHLEVLKFRDDLEGFSDRQVKVTDEGLAHVAKIDSLKVLEISDCGAITDVGMSYLSTMPGLEIFEMPNSAIGDEGVAHLSKLPRLKTLVMDGTRMTDKSLESLRSTKTLRTVWVGPAVTNSAIDKFKKETSVLGGRR